jgi:hypothetical protein
MARLKVFSGGTGRLQLDSDEAVVEEHSDLVTADFQAGVLLYLDDNNGALRCRFLARRRSPEQFVAVFKSEASVDVLDRFKRVLKETVDDAGWRIERDDEWTVQVFDAFGETTPEQPSDPIVRRIVEEYDRVTLGVPTEHEALQLLEHCRQERDKTTVAVCAGERPEHLSETEVVIRPNGEYDGVVPVGRTATRVRQEMAEEAYGDLQSAVAALADALEETIEEAHHRRVLMAIALRRAGMDGDDWTLVTEEESGRSSTVVESFRSIIGVGESGPESDETDPDDVVDGSTLEALSVATSELRTWTKSPEYRRAIERLVDQLPVEIEDK